jgi:peptide/nickel transport system permease protein
MRAATGNTTTRWRVPAALLGILAVVAIGAPLLAPHSPDVPLDYDTLRNLPPSIAHPFGTDGFGRDVLSRVIYGARVSLALALSAASLALVLGTCVGATAALLGGTVDRALMRALDVALSIPRLLFLLAVTAFSNALPLTALILLLGTTGWFDVARLIRGEVQSLMRRDFVLAAQASGVPRMRTFLRHLLPHLVPLLAVSATLNVAGTIALETGLSYLGLGVQPPTPSWGAILLDGSAVMRTQWWLTLFPGLAIVFAVFACHALGDALRDLFALDQVPA